MKRQFPCLSVCVGTSTQPINVRLRPAIAQYKSGLHPLLFPLHTYCFGTEQRAVFVYQIESYRYWEEQLKRADFIHGQFGENLTIEGLPDDAVCIGDRYQIGSALFEVTQPRVT